MKIRIYCVLMLSLLGVACQDDKSDRQAQMVKEQQKNEKVFEAISKAWNFQAPQLSPAAQGEVNGWEDWRMFLLELKQKPKSSIGAFQQKATTLSQKVDELEKRIPTKLQKTSVKSRISVLVTQIKSLDMYMHLSNIPQQRIVELIKEINYAVVSLQGEFEEIVRKSQIPTEQGESDLKQMQDTTRAIPNNPDRPKIIISRRIEQGSPFRPIR